jgi:hypothetical protein
MSAAAARFSASVRSPGWRGADVSVALLAADAALAVGASLVEEEEGAWPEALESRASGVALAVGCADVGFVPAAAPDAALAVGCADAGFVPAAAPDVAFAVGCADAGFVLAAAPDVALAVGCADAGFVPAAAPDVALAVGCADAGFVLAAALKSAAPDVALTVGCADVWFATAAARADVGLARGALASRWAPAPVARSSELEPGCGAAGSAGGGKGMGREALAGANTDRKARSAAEIRVSRGLSDCMHTL